MNEYNSFNLANVALPVAPKWKNNDFILDEHCKFQHSCRMIFDGPMAHITSGEVKTNMFLIWAGPDRQDIYDNFNLTVVQHHDIDYVMQQFEEFYALICNFIATYFKFTRVYQKQGETIDISYNRILKICDQCEFSDPDERLIGAIIFGLSIVKAQDKLLQMPKTLNLQQCLTVCRHYKSLKLHIEQIRPNKSVDYLKQHHNKKKGQSGQST